MDELLNNIVKLPTATKAAILAGVVVVITALNWFVWPGVSSTLDQVDKAERTLVSLQDQLVEKRAIANDLNKYRREMEILQARLDDALTEMPEEVNMDDLLTRLAELARKAGLDLVSISPEAETPEGGFYYRIPISMKVAGSYPEIAVFLDSVGKMKRIVNINNIDLASPKEEEEQVVLNASYLATTFRFAGEQQEQAAGAGRGAQPRRGR